MAIAFTFIHKDLYSTEPTIEQALQVQRGTKTTLDRPVIVEDIIDPETKEIIGQRRYPQAESVEVESPIYHGGIIKIGKVPGNPNWQAVLLQSTQNRLASIASQAGNKMILLAVAKKDGDGVYNWDSILSSVNRTKINNWLSGKINKTIPAGWTERKVVQELFNRVNNRFEWGAFGVRDNE